MGRVSSRGSGPAIAKTRQAASGNAPRGILQRAAGAHAFEHDRYAPARELAPFVEHFWSVSWDLRGRPSVVAETLPHPCVQVTIDRGRALVGGVATRRFTRRLQGRGRVFGIKFRPGAFYPFSGTPLSRITNQVRRLRSVFGPSTDALQDAVWSSPPGPDWVQAAERFLLERLPVLPPAVARTRDLVERMAVDRGIVRVEQVVTLAGMNLRQLQRAFRTWVGVSPKWVIRRYRLHEAVERLARPQAPAMADLAAELGYFDQAHFIRDFKATIGRSPGAYLRARAGKRASSGED